ALEDVTRVTQAVAQRLYDRKALRVEPSTALQLRESRPRQALDAVAEALGGERKTFAGEVLKGLEQRRTALWVERIHKKINWELFARRGEAFTWAALEERGGAARTGRDLLDGVPHGEDYRRFVEEATRARNGKDHDKKSLEPFTALRLELEKPFGKGLIL